MLYTMNKPLHPLDYPSVIAAICLVGGIGALIFNIFPVLVGSAADSRQLSSQEVGLIGTAYFLGYTLASVASMFWVTRINWRVQSIITVAIAISGLAYAAATQSYASLLGGFFVTGCGCGAIFALTLYIVGCSRDPDRIFGFKIFVEIAIPAFMVWILTSHVIDTWGLNGALVSIMVLFAVLAVGTIALPGNTAPYTTGATDSSAETSTGPVSLVWLSLVGLLVWMCGTTGTWVFLERMGNDRGFATDEIGLVLTVALLVSALGALSAGFVGDRLGRKLPLMTASFIALAALGLLWMGNGFLGYALALSLFSFGWVAAYPYVLGIVASADFKGNLVVLASAALSAGGAIGPGIAGVIKSGESYQPVLVFGGVSMLAGLLIFLYVLKQLDRFDTGIEVQAQRLAPDSHGI